MPSTKTEGKPTAAKTQAGAEPLGNDSLTKKEQNDLYECVQKAASSWLVKEILGKIVEHHKLNIDVEKITPDNVPDSLRGAVLEGFWKTKDARLERKLLVEILKSLNDQFCSRIIGQDELCRTVLISLVLNEHALLEGLPGVGKTEIIKWVAEVCGMPFSRVQFIPDMLPSDLIGKDHIDLVRLDQKRDDAVQWVNGPVFGSIVLADEINRAPSKVQSALLEAMGERQVTPFGKLSRAVINPLHEAALSVWREKNKRGLLGIPNSIPLTPRAMKSCSQFTVFATMNPIEQEGTYPLSEAQTDRFCFKVIVPYPSRAHYEKIARAVYYGDQCDAIEVTLATRKCLQYLRNHPNHTLFVLLPVYFFLLCRSHIIPLKIHLNDKDAGVWETNRVSMYEQMQKAVEGDGNGRMLELMYDLVCMTNARNALLGEAGVGTGQYDVVQLELRKFVIDLADSNKDSNCVSRQQARDIKEKKSRAARLSRVMDAAHCQYVKAGASPRGFLKLVPSAICHAMIQGREEVREEDVRAVVSNVLRHRIHMDVHSRLAGVSAEDVIHKVCQLLMER